MLWRLKFRVLCLNFRIYLEKGDVDLEIDVNLKSEIAMLTFRKEGGTAIPRGTEKQRPNRQS